MAKRKSTAMSSIAAPDTESFWGGTATCVLCVRLNHSRKCVKGGWRKKYLPDWTTILSISFLARPIPGRLLCPLALGADVSLGNVAGLPRALSAALIALTLACGLHDGVTIEGLNALAATGPQPAVREVSRAGGFALALVEVKLVGAGQALCVHPFRGDAEAAVDAVLALAAAGLTLTWVADGDNLPLKASERRLAGAAILGRTTVDMRCADRAGGEASTLVVEGEPLADRALGRLTQGGDGAAVARARLALAFIAGSGFASLALHTGWAFAVDGEATGFAGLAGDVISLLQAGRTA